MPRLSTVLVILLVTLAGCSGGNATTPTESPTPTGATETATSSPSPTLTPSPTATPRKTGANLEDEIWAHNEYNKTTTLLIQVEDSSNGSVVFQQEITLTSGEEANFDFTLPSPGEYVIMASTDGKQESVRWEYHSEDPEVMVEIEITVEGRITIGFLAA